MLETRQWGWGLGLVALFAAGLAGAQSSGSATLSQGEWAKMLVQRLGAADVLRQNATVEDATSLLGTRGLSVSRDGKSAKAVTADGAQRTWRYEVDLPRTATWLVTVRENAQPAFVSVDKLPSKLVAAGGPDGATDVGLLPLAAGAHAITVSGNLPTAPDLSIVAGCRPVLPAGGWQSSAKLTYGNLGRTLVQALRQDGRLPASEGLAVSPASASRLTLDVPAEGTYTLLLGGSALTRATYRLGGCEETTPGAPAADGWREGATVHLPAGPQTLELAGVDAKRADGRVRLVRRSTADAEYLAVLQSMGVKLTSDGKTTGALDAGDARIGLARRANGDSKAGLAALANRPVPRDEGERILNSPPLAKLFAGNYAKKDDDKPKTKKDDDEVGGTLVEPVTGTLQPAQDADPQ